MSHIPTKRTTSDWVEWHQRYDSVDAYRQRLQLVQARIVEAVDSRPPGVVTLVSMCAGQGRDVAGALAGHPRRQDVKGRLVELDPRNVDIARNLLDRGDLGGIEVAAGDAAQSGAYAGAVPADIVLACGIFGNVSDTDIEHTVKNVSVLCAAGATVIWTRHRAAPDLTPTIRRWFGEVGFEEVGFDCVDDGPQSVGTHRLTVVPAPFDRAVTFFEFR